MILNTAVTVLCPVSRLWHQQVFNDQTTFSEWFTRFLGSDVDNKQPSAGGGGAEASAMDREKRILVVNRLHQILSPFMLRRMVSATTGAGAARQPGSWVCAALLDALGTATSLVLPAQI